MKEEKKEEKKKWYCERCVYNTRHSMHAPFCILQMRLDAMLKDYDKPWSPQRISVDK